MKYSGYFTFFLFFIISSMTQDKEVFYLLHWTLQNKHCQPLFNFYWKVLMHVTMIIDQFIVALLIVDVWAKCGYNKV